MAGVSDWLEAARDEGGLLIPANPTKHGCDLILKAEHVEVHAGDEAGAALGWDELDSMHRPLDGFSDRWRFDAWATATDVGPLRHMAGSGVGITVHRRCHAVTVQVMAARDTRRNRFNRSMAKGAAVPLAPWSRMSPTLAHNALLIDVLCAVLAERPEARARLDDPARVTQLAADLKDRPLELVDIPLVARSATVEVLEALRRLDRGHRYGGRPVPGDPLPSADELAAALRQEGVGVDPDQIREVVEERHLAVDPWPFEAVTVD